MAANHGEGVYGNGAGVTTPLDHKMAQVTEWVKTAANTIRPGLLWDGSATVVSGTASMSYSVRPFSIVTTRGAAAGAVKWASAGTEVVVTTAAPGSNSRIDVVYAWHREYSIDGTNSDPVIGVAQGSSAASPTAPSLAAFPGAVELARITVPTGVTATNSGTTIVQTAPFTAAAGGVVPVRNTTERDGSSPYAAATWTPGQLIFLLDSLKYQQTTNGTTWTDLVPVGGLAPIIPTSVAAGSGTASAGAAGKVSMTTVGTSISLNGVFTSSYDNYLVVGQIPTKSAAGNFNVRLRAAGTDSSTAVYDFLRGIDLASSRNVATSTAATSWQSFHGANYADSSFELHLIGPNLARATKLRATVTGTDAAGVIEDCIYTGVYRNTTAYDGLTLLISTGTWTGEIRVYGYNNL